MSDPRDRMAEEADSYKYEQSVSAEIDDLLSRAELKPPPEDER